MNNRIQQYYDLESIDELRNYYDIEENRHCGKCKMESLILSLVILGAFSFGFALGVSIR